MTDPQAEHVLADLGDVADRAQLPLVLGHEAGGAERALHLWFPSVYGLVGDAADGEGVVLVVQQLVLVGGGFLAGLEYLPGLLRNLRPGSEFQEPSCEGGGCPVVLQLEEHIQRSP